MPLELIVQAVSGVSLLLMLCCVDRALMLSLIELLLLCVLGGIPKQDYSLSSVSAALLTNRADTVALADHRF